MDACGNVFLCHPGRLARLDIEFCYQIVSAFAVNGRAPRRQIPAVTSLPVCCVNGPAAGPDRIKLVYIRAIPRAPLQNHEDITRVCTYAMAEQFEKESGLWGGASALPPCFARRSSINANHHRTLVHLTSLVCTDSGQTNPSQTGPPGQIRLSPCPSGVN